MDTFCDLPLVPFENIEKEFSPDEFKMFIPLSYKSVNRIRAQKYYEAKEKGYSLTSFVSTKAMIFKEGTTIGDNCFIFENNVIQPFTTIGNNVIIWSGNHIGHHSHIEDHCFLASHIVVSGGVTIEPYCFIGVNATIRDHVTVGAESVIGAGALIVKDTKPKSVYKGSPAVESRVTSDQLRSL